MPYFKTPDNSLHYLDDFESLYLLPSDAVHIADEEANNILNGKTSVDLVKQYTFLIQKHLDDKAREHGYDDIRSVVTYADEPSVPKFQNEGLAFRKWRSLVWAYCGEQLATAEQTLSPPTVEELFLNMPRLEDLYGN